MGRRRRTGNKVDGWVVLDKPVGLTSTQAVAKARWAFHAQKAGHAGTLDPLASGCLPIALGEATKTVSFAMEGRKTYRFTLRWGQETNTDDAEGEVAASSDIRPDNEEIAAILPRFTGEIMQVPPAFSAIKIAGERAYDLARDGEEVDLTPRQITVNALRLEDRPDADHAMLYAECGKGAYVRALARDIGRELGTHAHVTALRRLSVGPFVEDDMISLEMLEELRHNPAALPAEMAGKVLRPLELALDGIPALNMSERDAARLKCGQAVIIRGRDAPIISGPAYATASGVPVALGEVEKGAFNPRRVFNLGDGWPPPH